MAITPEQIDKWRSAASETQNLEFKEAKRQFDEKRLFKYCVAIANEGGGHLLLGIADKAPRPVVGSAAFKNPIATAPRLFNALKFRVDIEEVMHPDGRVVVFSIPPRPIGTAYEYEGSYWMRTGEELRPMSPDQLRKIFTEGQPGWLDNIALPNLTAQEVVHLLDTQTFFDLLKLPYPSNRKGDIARLLDERLIEETAGGFSILNIGAMLLAKNLRQFAGVSRKAARIIVYAGESRSQTTQDITMEKGYAVGFKDLVSNVMSLLPQNEIIEGAIRNEIKLIPEIVIRELLANALIHQDLEMSGVSPSVEIYSNRVEISNPGEPMVPPDRFIDGYESRNERLADLMRRFGICEERSSGIDKVVEEIELLQLPAPAFLVPYNRTQVVIHGPRQFKDMDGADRRRACYQHCVLQWVLSRPMTNQSLRKRFGLSDGSGNAVSQIIAATVEQRLVKIDPDAPDSRRYARYIPAWA